MNHYQYLAQSVKLDQISDTEAKLIEHHPDLDLIGVGRSAFVFKIRNQSKVLKVFFPKQADTCREEVAIYQTLDDSPYFSPLYDFGERYLVIDYIEGKTFYQCLIEGIFIPPNAIEQVDDALTFIQRYGLKPSDVHLKNIILTPEQNVKLIDLARFRQDKFCSQWEDLKKAYYRVYLFPLFPKKIPKKILDTISKTYKKNHPVMRLLGFGPSDM